MKLKKEKSKAPEKRMIRSIGEDPTKLIAELNPGKKGGNFELPFGGRVSIPAGLLGKKDVVTCCMMSPSDRHKYMPPLRSKERLLSEIYLIATSLKSLGKEGLFLRLPFYEENAALFDSFLMWKKMEEDDWSTKQYNLSKKGHSAEFVADSGGIFAMICRPKSERFDIPVQGCLYNSRLSHQVSVRFAKKATSIDLFGDILISPVNRDNLPNLYKDFPHDMNDLVTLSDYVAIETSIPTSFKRPATVKLPLPPLQSESFPEEDMVVMAVDENGGWQLLDVPLKFTKSAVSFETKVLSKFCVAQSTPNRKRRLVNAFKHLDEDGDAIRGKILVFLHVQEKLWTLWVECVANDKVDQHVHKMESQGFRKIGLVEPLKEDVIEDKPSFRSSSNWRANNKSKPANSKKTKRDDIDLLEGMQFELDLDGDITLSSDDTASTYTRLHYYSRLEDNYRKFFVEPKRPIVPSYTDISSVLNVYVNKTGSKVDEEKSERICVQSFNVDASKQEFEAYYYEPPPPLEPEPEPEQEPEPLIEREPAPVAPTNRPPTAAFLRLITPMKPPRKIQRESKVLTGRSLMCLAKEIEQGLTLAIHLDISDSTITGMGFDALAKGLTLIDITYRILLLWKRRTTKYKSTQVDLLVSALEDMGKNDIATIVRESHNNNKELTPSSFDAAIYQRNGFVLN